MWHKGFFLIFVLHNIKHVLSLHLDKLAETTFMRYLNPKADLTFKKVFGEHQDIVISFLNALQSFSSSRREAMKKGFNEGFDKRDGKRY